MTTLRLVARLMDSGGNPLSGKTIYFYYSTDGSTWINFVAVATDSNGYAFTTYDANQKTWFKAEFRGDSDYDPASATVVWEPSGGQTTQPSQCQPLFRTGIGVLDQVVFCIGGVGVSVSVLLVAFFVLLMLVRRKR
jgi:hypothetical protein